MDDHDTAEHDPAAPIEHELDVAVSRERAWDAYVHGMTDWWPVGWTRFGTGVDRIDVEPHPGGRIVEHSRTGEEHVWGEVTEADPGERFAHTFRLSHEGDPSTVVVAFTELPHGGTRVHFTHGGWNDSNREARVKHADWPKLLERYRTHAQHI